MRLHRVPERDSQDVKPGLASIYRTRLRKLCQDSRYGTHFLPPDDGGRAMLLLLRRLGLTDEGAMEDAPCWLDAAELPKLRREAWTVKWNTFGQMIRLTYDEYETFKLWWFTPSDIPPEETKRRNAARAK